MIRTRKIRNTCNHSWEN